MKDSTEGLFKNKGSKFLSYAFPVATEEEKKNHLTALRKLHPSARHHCYAFRIRVENNLYRVNDGGEPNNTAGKPILGQIESKELTNILIVVMRYFGGTLLGVSGLINAYKLAAADTLSNATLIEKTVNEMYQITFNYSHMNDVMSIMKEKKLDIHSQNFELLPQLLFSVRKSKSANVIDMLNKISNLEIKFIKQE
ncbi:MAG: YigZ family protein [Bacteroidia bacterium]